MICEHCKIGNLVASGEGFMSNPPRWANYCDRCGEVTLRVVRYGTTEQQEVLRKKLHEGWTK